MLGRLARLTNSGQHGDGVIEGAREAPLTAASERRRLGHHRLDDAVVVVGDVVFYPDHGTHVCKQKKK